MLPWSSMEETPGLRCLRCRLRFRSTSLEHADAVRCVLTTLMAPLLDTMMSSHSTNEREESSSITCRQEMIVKCRVKRIFARSRQQSRVVDVRADLLPLCQCQVFRIGKTRAHLEISVFFHIYRIALEVYNVQRSCKTKGHVSPTVVTHVYRLMRYLGYDFCVELE